MKYMLSNFVHKSLSQCVKHSFFGQTPAPQGLNFHHEEPNNNPLNAKLQGFKHFDAMDKKRQAIFKHFDTIDKKCKQYKNWILIKTHKITNSKLIINIILQPLHFPLPKNTRTKPYYKILRMTIIQPYYRFLSGLLKGKFECMCLMIESNFLI